MIELDAAWRGCNPLPPVDGATTKNARGQVLVVGGAREVPGAVRLTGEAALRAGAGKVQIATFEAAALAIGILFPEAGVIALGEADGQLDVRTPGPLLDAVGRNDAVVIGPGMADKGVAAKLIEGVAEHLSPDGTLLLDAAGAACAGPLTDLLGCVADRLVLTPHAGEMASLTGLDIHEIEGDPARIAANVARRFRAVVALKGGETVIAAPDGTLIHYAGGGPGLGTGGSGDVLAGIIAGLLSRGTAPLQAAAWGVWLHGEAGRVLAGKVAPLGFLARELPAELPALMPR